MTTKDFEEFFAETASTTLSTTAKIINKMSYTRDSFLNIVKI
jgi:hypothetical protein